MAYSLQGVRLRQQRAVHHYNIMKTELQNLPEEAKTITFRTQFDPETNLVHAHIAAIPDFPAHWGLIASEAFFNARAALDYLVWELARWNLQQQGKSREPHGRTQFPIATQPSLFKQSQVSDLHPDHVAEILRFQPYGEHALSQFPTILAGRDDNHALTPQTHLARLMRINDQDKHRVLRPIGASVWQSEIGAHVAIDCEIVAVNIFLQDQLKVDAKWAEFDVRPIGARPSVEVRDRVTPDVTFGDFDFFRGFPGVVNMINEVVESFLGVF